MSEPTSVTLTSSKEQRAALSAKEAKIDARFWNVPLPKEKSEGEEEGSPEAWTSIHAQCHPWAERLWASWSRLRQRDREHDLIYENRQLRMGGKYHPGVRALELAGFDTSTLFVTTSIVDTFDARLSKRKTLPMFVVDEAEWDLRQQAEDFRKWLHGKLSQVEYEKVYGECVTDMLVRGDGAAYIDEGADDVFVERVHRSELLINPYEAKQGREAVRTMYRFRTVSRDSLIARFPEYAEQIKNAPKAPDRGEDMSADWLSSERNLGEQDLVDFGEAWHLPDRECADEEDGGGRKVVFLANCTLCYEEWKAPRFPIALLSCHRPRRGFWSRGIVEKLRPLQTQINRMVADIAMNVAVTGKGIWVVPENFDIPVEKLTGYRPFKLPYRGPRAPEFTHPPPINPTTLELLRQKIAWAHDLVGAAQWSAQGKSPLGAGASGVAIDTMEDLLSDRHSKLEENCSLFRLDCSQCLLDAAGRVAKRMKAANDNEAKEAEEAGEEEEFDEAYEDDEGEEQTRTAKRPKKPKPRAYYSTWLDKGRLERLDWNQVAMTKEQYHLQLEPVSFLSQTRSGKLAQVAELVQHGAIEPQYTARLYDEPDIAHVNRNRLAMQNNGERIMLILGKPKQYPEMPAPEEWHDLDGNLLLCKQYYNRAQNEGAPDEVQTRYREYGALILALKKTIKKREAEEQAAMAPPAPPPGMPPGPPMPGDPMAGGMPPGMPMGPGGMDPSAMGGGGMPPAGAPPMAA